MGLSFGNLGRICRRFQQISFCKNKHKNIQQIYYQKVVIAYMQKLHHAQKLEPCDFYFFIWATYGELFTNFCYAATIYYLKATPLFGTAFILLMINTLWVSFCINYLKAEIFLKCQILFMFLYKV